MKPFTVAIVGCGGVGRKRGLHLPIVGDVVCCDTRLDRALDLAFELSNLGCEVTESQHWQHVVRREDVDIVIVATPHDMLFPVAMAAISAKKHVFIEKPGACSVREISEIEAQANRNKVSVAIGFNHRFHPAFLKAKSLFDSYAIGTPMMVRGRYGHGGRVGYEKEWRADPKKGGGELMDQGVHLIDLSRAFLGDFTQIIGVTKTMFWSMDVDDNAFMILQTAKGQIAHLHASCTEWRNLFSLEVYGTTGKLHLEGLGGSYGLEQLSFYRMLPKMGPPETTVWQYPRADDSWRLELEAFFERIRSGTYGAHVQDAREALRVVEQIRLQSDVGNNTVETAG